MSGASRGWPTGPVLWLMLALLLVRAFFAAALPLIVDEAYAIAVAREFSLSFFEHPPIGFWAPVLSAQLLGFENPLIFRLPALIFGTVSAFLVWRIGALLWGARAGFWGLALYAAAPAFAFSGVFSLPDSPLYFGLLLSAYWLVRILQVEGVARLRWWVWVGGALAFALASKYQAALFPIGALIFALLHPTGRRWFAQPGPYIASAIGLVGLVPVLLWNMQHDWVSFAFHSGRTGQGLRPVNFARLGVAQMLYLLPPVGLLALWAVGRTFRTPAAGDRLLLWLGLPALVLFNVIYLFSASSFPHWAMPGWVFAVLLAGGMAAAGSAGFRRRAALWVGAFAAFTGLLLLVLTLHVRTGLVTAGQSQVPVWDDTVTTFDYRMLHRELKAKNILQEGGVIGVRNWIDAGLISAGLGGAFPVRPLQGNPHHFQFMNGPSKAGPGLVLVPGLWRDLAQVEDEALQMARVLDPSAQKLAPIILKRGSRDYIAVAIVRLTLPDASWPAR